MKILVFFVPMTFCFPFPAVPNIAADIGIEHQSVHLRNCIRETTAHYIQEVVAAGGLPTDRLHYSKTQIQQLCIASQTTPQISETTSGPIIEIVSSPPTSTESQNGINSVIDLLQELETFKLMLGS
jgi:hypothetical protein